MTIEVFIPAYNCGDTLPRTLASLAAQTDADFRVCVVNDHSTDDANLRGICERFSASLNIRYIYNKINIGCGMSRQAAIDTSDADYLIPLDADDCLLPMAIELFRQSARFHPDADFFSAWAYSQIPDPRGGNGYNTLKDGLTLVSGKMYRRAFLQELGIRNCDRFSRFADDTYFNILCFELGKVQYIDFPAYLYVRNPNSVTNTNGGQDYWARVVPKFLDCLTVSTQEIVKHKPGSEIMHLDNTIPYIRAVVTARNEADEIVAYNQCVDRLIELGVPDKFDRI